MLAPQRFGRLLMLATLVYYAGCASEKDAGRPQSAEPPRITAATAPPRLEPPVVPESSSPPESAPAADASPVVISPAPVSRAIQPRVPVRASGAELQPQLEPRPRFQQLTQQLGQNAIVELFYATDRRGTDRRPPTTFDYLKQFQGAASVALVVSLIALGYQAWRRQRPPLWLSCSGATAIGAALILATLGSLRMADDARRLGRVYGNERGDLEWGKCAVSIPRDHDPGALESPSITRFEFREDPKRHVILQSVIKLGEPEFYRQLSAASDAHTNRDLFVFVHGFNVTFSDAARRAAQMAHDLPYTGTPVLFTWPSQGRADPIAYTTDGTTAEWSTAHLEQFLDGLIQQFGSERLNLVAHSMGNRLLTSAVRQLALRGRIPHKMREIVLAAPDVDAAYFRRDLAPILVQVAERVTLYASNNDEALKMSRRLNGAPRAGDTGELLVVAPGIDTIDVSAVDTTLLGHTYYGSNVTVLADLFYLLTRNLPTEQRVWLEPRDRDGLRYWVLERKALEETAAKLQVELHR